MSKCSSPEGNGKQDLTVCLFSCPELRTNLSLPFFFRTILTVELQRQRLWLGVINLFSKNLLIFRQRSFLKIMGILRVGNFTVFEPGQNQTCAERCCICQYPILISRTHRKKWAKERELCMNLWIHGRFNFFQHFLNFLLVWNLALRMIKQVCDDSTQCRPLRGFNHRKTSRRCTLLDSYITNRINEANWYHLFRLSGELKADNCFFSQKRVIVQKYPRFPPKQLCVNSSHRITASSQDGMKLVSRAIT